LYSRWTKETTKPKQAAKPESKEGLRSSEDYREYLLGAFILCDRFLTLDKPLETSGGHIYSVDAESKEEIKDALRDLYWAIHDVIIHTQIVATKESTELYAKAESDTSFHNFMSGLVRSTGLAKAGK
jgi:hypothetical protein